MGKMEVIFYLVIIPENVLEIIMLIKMLLVILFIVCDVMVSKY